jgi:hypothetical protein
MINLGRAKELLIVLLPYLRGTNLYNALDAPELPGENEQFIKQQQDLSTRLHTTNANTKYETGFRLKFIFSQRSSS